MTLRMSHVILRKRCVPYRSHDPSLRNHMINTVLFRLLVHGLVKYK